jgi:SAM-dependent methyltransferase
MPHAMPTPEDLRASVIDRFARVAVAPAEERRFPVGPESARRLGYDPSVIDPLPPGLAGSFCGVGNPFSLGEPKSGQVVLDLGCGAGFDTLLAAKCVGEAGKVVGIDVTPEMLAKARQNAAVLGVTNVGLILGEIESLPLPEESVDLVISNGVFNLCPDKPRVLGEVLRVLKPGGRLQMADILLEPDLTPEEVASKGSWSD